MIEIILGPNEANRRFDRFLCAYLSRAPQSLVHKLLRKKRIKLNGRRALGNEITACEDKVTFYLAPETLQNLTAKSNPPPSNLGPVDIIYEDEHILLINKPAGLLTHSSKPGLQDTLVGRLNYYLNGVKNTDSLAPNYQAPCHSGQNPKEDDAAKPRNLNFAVCNRLDRNTSGLVICGKNMATIQGLNAIFAARKVEKTYLAVVCGLLNGKGDLRGYLYKDERANRSYITERPLNNAVPVHTEYECLKSGGGFSLIKVKLHTGRPHQIRAHFAALGHPLAGDAKYGGQSPLTDGTNRLASGARRGQMLHSLSLRFLKSEAAPHHLTYLAGQEWSAPAPEEFWRL